MSKQTIAIAIAVVGVAAGAYAISQRDDIHTPTWPGDDGNDNNGDDNGGGDNIIDDNQYPDHNYPEHYSHVKYRYGGAIISLRQARQLILKNGYDVVVPELRREDGTGWRRGSDHESAIIDLQP